jgi:uncharacterized membrane protein YciS (DUF1049 family)
MEKKPISNIVAGSVIAGLIIVYSIIVYFAGLQANQALSYVTYAILVLGVVYFVNAYGKANDYRMSFGNLFAYGFKVTAFTALVFIAFLIIFNLIFPEFREKIFEMMRQNLEKQGKLTDEQIGSYVESMRKLFMVFIIAGTLFFFAIFGAIGGLIGAAVTKRNPPSSPFENPV